MNDAKAIQAKAERDAAAAQAGLDEARKALDEATKDVQAKQTAYDEAVKAREDAEAKLKAVQDAQKRQDDARKQAEQAGQTTTTTGAVKTDATVKTGKPATTTTTGTTVGRLASTGANATLPLTVLAVTLAAGLAGIAMRIHVTPTEHLSRMPAHKRSQRCERSHKRGPDCVNPSPCVHENRRIRGSGPRHRGYTGHYCVHAWLNVRAASGDATRQSLRQGNDRVPSGTGKD